MRERGREKREKRKDKREEGGYRAFVVWEKAEEKESNHLFFGGGVKKSIQFGWFPGWQREAGQRGIRYGRLQPPQSGPLDIWTSRYRSEPCWCSITLDVHSEALWRQQTPKSSYLPGHESPASLSTSATLRGFRTFVLPLGWFKFPSVPHMSTTSSVLLKTCRSKKLMSCIWLPTPPHHLPGPFNVCFVSPM